MATEQVSKKNTFTLIKDSFSKFVVVPFAKFGLSGFAFDVEGETAIEQTAQITDHFVEDNSAIQDHMAIRPIKIKLTNYIGELVTRRDSDVLNVLADVVQKLTIVASLLPAITAASTQIQGAFSGQASSFEDITNASTNLWALVKNLNPFATEQQKAYLFFNALQEQKILVSILTPYGFFTNMAIESIVSKQNEESESITDFSITLKKIRTASVLTTKFDKEKYQSRNQQQRQDVAKKGKAQGKKVSLLQQLTNAVTQ